MMMDNKLRVIIDTNCLLVAISSKSAYHWLYQAILTNKLSVYITNEILSEYAEVLNRHYNLDTSQAVLRTLLELPNVYPVTIFYKFNLITEDVDDNKFVDCAFAANAHYIISNDKHFNVLKNIKFPSIEVISLDSFKSMADTLS